MPKPAVVTHCFDWWLLDHRMYGYAYDELSCSGITSLCFTNTHFLELQKDRAFGKMLKDYNKEFGMHFGCAHAHWGNLWDFCTMGAADRVEMLKTQKWVLDVAADFEIPLVMYHPGYSPLESDPTYPIDVMREMSIRTLEILIPYAEKRGIKMSIENNISPADTPAELRKILEHFNSPTLGCCYDSGHAHQMWDRPGKDPGKFIPFVRGLWKDGVKLYPTNGLEELIPWINSCHLHDNDGQGDWHHLPGSGNIDWKEIISGLDRAPNLVCVMNETGRTAVSRIAKTFRELWETRTSPLLQ